MIGQSSARSEDRHHLLATSPLCEQHGVGGVTYDKSAMLGAIRGVDIGHEQPPASVMVAVALALEGPLLYEEMNASNVRTESLVATSLLPGEEPQPEASCRGERPPARTEVRWADITGEDVEVV